MAAYALTAGRRGGRFSAGRLSGGGGGQTPALLGHPPQPRLRRGCEHPDGSADGCDLVQARAEDAMHSITLQEPLERYEEKLSCFNKNISSV